MEYSKNNTLCLFLSKHKYIYSLTNMYTVQSIVYIVQCTVYVQSTMYNV